MLHPKEKDKGMPWAFVFGSNAPHTPWTDGDASQFDPSTFTVLPYHYSTAVFRETLTHYYAEVAFLDGQIGEIDAMLTENKLDSNTVMIFTTEQGAQLPGKYTSLDFNRARSCSAYSFVISYNNAIAVI